MMLLHFTPKIPPRLKKGERCVKKLVKNAAEIPEKRERKKKRAKIMPERKKYWQKEERKNPHHQNSWEKFNRRKNADGKKERMGKYW